MEHTFCFVDLAGFSALTEVHGDDALDVIDPICRMRVIPNRAAAHLETEGEEYWFCSSDCLRQFVTDNGRPSD